MGSLVTHTLFGIEDKVEIAVERLRTFEPPEGYWLAYSGGKDSQVILGLANRAGVRFDAHYQVTTVDAPELVHFIRREHPEVKFEVPKKTMWQLIREHHMPPMRMARYCCQALKENGGSGRLVVTGIRWQESVRRKGRRMVETCMRDTTKTYLHVIIDWSEADVWGYIRGNNLPYCSLYDEGWRRIGCVLCPMLTPWMRRRDAERWPKIAAAYKRAITAICDPATKNRWTDPERAWAWWLNGRMGDTRDELSLFD